MIVRLTLALLLFATISSLSGCLYRGEGIFKRIGDSDYKARIEFQDLAAVGDGGLTAVNGVVLLEDHVTPLRNVPVRLVRKKELAVVSTTTTDNVGRFVITGTLYSEPYFVEIESSQYTGSKEISINPNRQNSHLIVVEKR